MQIEELPPNMWNDEAENEVEMLGGDQISDDELDVDDMASCVTEERSSHLPPVYINVEPHKKIAQNETQAAPFITIP